MDGHFRLRIDIIVVKRRRFDVANPGVEANTRLENNEGVVKYEITLFVRVITNLGGIIRVVLGVENFFC